MICSKDCKCKPGECTESDIIDAAIRLLRVIDGFGTRLEETDAINRLRIAALATGYMAADRSKDAAN